MWHEGCIAVNGIAFHYQAKVYDVGSIYGIRQGRISKLTLKQDGEVVLNYDRGWNVKPTTPEAEIALEILIYDYA